VQSGARSLGNANWWALVLQRRAMNVARGSEGLARKTQDRGASKRMDVLPPPPAMRPPASKSLKALGPSEPVEMFAGHLSALRKAGLLISSPGWVVGNYAWGMKRIAR